jgi:hypothetical protein
MAITEEFRAIQDGILTPQFLSDAEESLFAEAVLGQNAIDFLNTDLGRVLRGYAEQELEISKQKLLKTPFWRWRKIIKLQQRAAVAQQFLSFIQEALTRGRVAEQNLEQMRING